MLPRRRRLLHTAEKVGKVLLLILNVVRRLLLMLIGHGRAINGEGRSMTDSPLSCRYVARVLPSYARTDGLQTAGPARPSQKLTTDCSSVSQGRDTAADEGVARLRRV